MGPLAAVSIVSGTRYVCIEPGQCMNKAIILFSAFMPEF
jgi:hypothetical protein